MQHYGETFIKALPAHLKRLKLPGRAINDDLRRDPLPAQIKHTEQIQAVMHEVLYHPVTDEAHGDAEAAFEAFLKKDVTDVGLLRFFNGWFETHKTTSLVSAKIIMRLAADALSVRAGARETYHNAMAHMHEVAKDDFGLGHKGHDGMYGHMVQAFNAQSWVERRYQIGECNDFSRFLYDTGVAGHKSAMDSPDHKRSIMDAMMVSISSELWNGREYNFLTQYIEQKLIAFSPTLRDNANKLRDAKRYVTGHSGEVENKHGLHALAAAQAYSHASGVRFEVKRLKAVMLDYNSRVGRAFRSMHAALVA